MLFKEGVKQESTEPSHADFLLFRSFDGFVRIPIIENAMTDSASAHHSLSLEEFLERMPKKTRELFVAHMNGGKKEERAYFEHVYGKDSTAIVESAKREAKKFREAGGTREEAVTEFIELLDKIDRRIQENEASGNLTERRKSV